MASIFDLENDADYQKIQAEKPVTTIAPKKRSKHREALTGMEVASGKLKLSEMVERAFATLEIAMVEADHQTAIKAAQIVLDRSGFGPKTTVDVNTTHMDLSQLSREELASRASELANRLRNAKTVEGVVIPAEKTLAEVVH